MKRVSFTVYAEPYGKVNMKPVFMKGHQSLVQPKANSNYMALVKTAYMESINNNPYDKEIMFNEEARINLHIKAYFSIPKNFSKVKTKLALEFGIDPIKRPDCDNISKIVCDSLNKLAFRDDSQITRLVVEKHYATLPRIEVEITDY